MAKFIYNNAKNTSIDHMIFELNHKYHFCIFYEKDLNLYSKLKYVENLFFEFQKLLNVY